MIGVDGEDVLEEERVQFGELQIYEIDETWAGGGVFEVSLEEMNGI